MYESECPESGKNLELCDIFLTLESNFAFLRIRALRDVYVTLYDTFEVLVNPWSTIRSTTGCTLVHLSELRPSQWKLDVCDVSR